jgi:hypothetical protein
MKHLLFVIKHCCTSSNIYTLFCIVRELSIKNLANIFAILRIYFELFSMINWINILVTYSQLILFWSPCCIYSLNFIFITKENVLIRLISLVKILLSIIRQMRYYHIASYSNFVFYINLIHITLFSLWT